jgi:hypothetical protein
VWRRWSKGPGQRPCWKKKTLVQKYLVDDVIFFFALAIPLFLDHPKNFSSSKSEFDLQNRFLTLGWSRFEIRVSF